MLRSCQQCNKEFSIYPSEFRKCGGKFCSKSCYFKWRKINEKVNHCLGCGIKTSDSRYVRCISCANEYFKKGKKVSEKLRLEYISHIPIRKGADCNFWKGGVSPLQMMIRNLLENKNWKKQVFKRDKYICQECYKKGGYLEAHHKKAFALICEEFLKEYSQFSPIEDKEVLARIAQSYSPFWDISNGQTLCESCHKNKRKIVTI